MKRTYTIAVVGLGYVGLPLALELSKHFHVIGYDVNSARINDLLNKCDKTNEATEFEISEYLKSESIFTNIEEKLSLANVFIVTVPTPVREDNTPDFDPLLSASRTVGAKLSKGNVVIYESTVFPGATEEICVPVLEETSGLSFRQDFFVGYSPERINPGDKINNLTNVIKVTSGCCEKSLDIVDGIYSQIVEAGTYRAPSIRVAEASKVIENTQRDINIAFMNELSLLFNEMNINTSEVLKAASTKWNFLNFRPGLVGGHCISIDPYYLQNSAHNVGKELALVKHAREINDSMPDYIVQKLISYKDINQNFKVLLKGVTFKEECPDVRNSKVINIYLQLKNFGFLVDVYDPLANSEQLQKDYNITLTKNIDKLIYDAIILAVPHEEFTQLTAEQHKTNLATDGLFFDLKSIYASCESDFQL